jgi:hypothetical protein
MKRSIALVAPLTLAAAACHSTYHAPTPLASIDLPSGTDLKPYNSAQLPTASPNATVQLGGKVWVALDNLYQFNPGGPGMLVGVVPSTGAKTVVDLGGSDGKQCQNPAALKTDGSKLYVACGSFSGTGTGVAEVDPASATVTRFVASPAGFVPSAMALTPTLIWLGDAFGDDIVSIDRKSFTAGTPQTLTCAAKNPFVSAMTVVGNDLFSLCFGTDGYLHRLDAATGASKADAALVGSGPIAIAQAGDGRLAIVNSLDVTLTLVTIGANTLTVQPAAFTFANSSDLEDVKALDQFAYVMIAGTQNVAKLDLSHNPPTLVEELNVNPAATPNANPNRLEVLDDNTVLVADFGLSKLIGAEFGKKAQ